MALATAALSCKEEIAAPGQCPALCPNARVETVDTTLTGVVTSDTSFRGYVSTQEAPILVISTLDSAKSLAVVRFVPRPTRWFPVLGDTVGVTIGTVDRATILLRFFQRDTSVKNLWMLVYRLPAKLDSTATYASMQPYFADSTLVDSVLVDSTLSADTLSFAVPKDRVEPLAADTGVVALGFALHAPQPTAVTIGAVDGSGAPAHLRFYARAPAPQDTLTHTFDQTPSFDTFVQSPVPPTPDGSALSVGNLPSARALVRFRLPRGIIDSTTVVRGTLVFTQVSPATGRPQDTFRLEARPLLRDFGAKSITYPDTSLFAHTSVIRGSSGAVELEIVRMLRFWGTRAADSLPRAIELRGFPEGSILGEVRLARGGSGAAAPQLRITYIQPFGFGVP